MTHRKTYFAKLEQEFLKILALLRSDLPDEIYKDYFELANSHAEYGIAFEALCDWLDRHQTPISRDIYRRLEMLGTTMQIENKLTWEILLPQVIEG